MKFSFNRLVTRGLKSWEWHPAMFWISSIMWLLLISWLAFFWKLGSTGLLDETEPLFAEAARQMTVTGDWITPFFDGTPRFDKPPLIYWLMASAYQTFGVNEFAARLPSALAGLTLTSFCFYTLYYFSHRNQQQAGKLVSDRQSFPHPLTPSPAWLVASLGAAIVALNPLTLFFGRTGYSDMLLSACCGGGLLAFFLGYAQPENRTVQARWYLAFYVLIALAVLTKGPVGVILPGLIIGSFLLYVGTKEVLREMRPIRGALIILTISLPWYVLVILRNGEAYIDSFFGYHNFERFTSVVNNHRGPWYFHFLIVLVGFFPWSIALPTAIALRVFQRRSWQSSPRSSHLGLFALFWFLIVLGFFTIAATKYFSYTLPLMPAAAILVALWWGDQMTVPFHQSHGRLKLTSLLSIVLFLVFAGVCFWCPHWLENDPSMPKLGLRIQQAGLSQIGAAIWGASAIFSAILLLRRQTQWLWAVKLLGFVAFLTFVIIPTTAVIDTERQLPLRQIAQSVVQVAHPGEELVMIADIFEKPSLVFYTQRPVTFLQRPKQAIPYIQKTNNHANSKSLLLVATRKALKNTKLEPNQYQKVSRAGIYRLVRVFKAGVG